MLKTIVLLAFCGFAESASWDYHRWAYATWRDGCDGALIGPNGTFQSLDGALSGQWQLSEQHDFPMILDECTLMDCLAFDKTTWTYVKSTCEGDEVQRRAYSDINCTVPKENTGFWKDWDRTCNSSYGRSIHCDGNYTQAISKSYFVGPHGEAACLSGFHNTMNHMPMEACFVRNIIFGNWIDGMQWVDVGLKARCEIKPWPRSDNWIGKSKTDTDWGATRVVVEYFESFDCTGRGEQFFEVPSSEEFIAEICLPAWRDGSSAEGASVWFRLEEGCGFNDPQTEIIGQDGARPLHGLSALSAFLLGGIIAGGL